jgi:cell division ATPase FtsA
VSARYEEIFDIIQVKLVELDRDWRLAGGVYLCGGATKIPGILDLAKTTFTLACFDAKEKRLHIPELSKNKQFLTAIGLYQRYTTYGSMKKSAFSFGFWWSWLTKIGNFFKDLF